MWWIKKKFCPRKRIRKLHQSQILISRQEWCQIFFVIKKKNSNIDKKIQSYVFNNAMDISNLFFCKTFVINSSFFLNSILFLITYLFWFRWHCDKLGVQDEDLGFRCFWSMKKTINYETACQNIRGKNHKKIPILIRLYLWNIHKGKLNKAMEMTNVFLKNSCD